MIDFIRNLQNRPLASVLIGVLVALALLAIGPSLLELDQVTQQLLGLGLAIIGLVSGGLLFRRMNRRLESLAAVAHSIGQGEYEKRSLEKYDDSIGVLGQSLDLMAEQIQQSMESLSQQQQDLENSRLQLKQQNESLEEQYSAQRSFGDYLTSLNAIDINTVAQRTVDTLMDACRMQFVLFYLKDDSGQSLRLIARAGVDQSVLENLEETAVDGLPGRVMLSGKPILVSGTEQIPFSDIDLGIGHCRIRSVYGAPVTFQGVPLATIVLVGINQFGDEERDIVERHLHALASSLNNALNYKTIQQQTLRLEQANMELIESDRLRSEFVANMSHELRTPLNSIIGFSGILQKNKNGVLGERELNYAEKVNRNGKHLLDLINDILDLSKIESGRMELEITPTDVSAVINEVADMLQVQVEARKLALAIEVSESLPVIPLDAARLKQVLINLVSNALKFTHQGTIKLRATVSDNKKQLNIDVVDSGIGIPEDKLQTIFEAFRQADSSTTRQYGGTGLGLAISRAFVEHMNGTLSVTSEVGKGSTFTIELPLSTKPEKQRSEKTRATAAVESESNLSGSAAVIKNTDEIPPKKVSATDIRTIQRALVIDDDPDARELLSNYLSEHVEEILTASGGKEGLEIVRQKKPDLITLDLMMPEMSGWEVLNELKQDPELAEIPVVVVSIVAETSKATVFGAVDAISKPVTAERLSSAIERCLDGHKDKARILVVDDEEDARTLVCSMLADQVKEIRTAGNGREALATLESYSPDLIILDLMMPIMDGMSFLRVMRSDHRFAGIPVAILTAKQLTRAEYRELETRAAAVIQKGDQLLAERLEEALSHVL